MPSLQSYARVDVSQYTCTLMQLIFIIFNIPKDELLILEIPFSGPDMVMCSGLNTTSSRTSPLLHIQIQSLHFHTSHGFPGLTDQALVPSQIHIILPLWQRNPLYLAQWQSSNFCAPGLHVLSWMRSRLNTKFPYLHWELIQEGDLSFHLSALGQSVFSSVRALLCVSRWAAAPQFRDRLPPIFMLFLWLQSPGLPRSLRITSWSSFTLTGNGSVMASGICKICDPCTPKYRPSKPILWGLVKEMWSSVEKQR